MARLVIRKCRKCGAAVSCLPSETEPTCTRCDKRSARVDPELREINERYERDRTRRF